MVEMVNLFLEQGVTVSVCGVFIYTSLKREEKLYNQMNDFKNSLDSINKTLKIIFERENENDSKINHAG